MKIGLVNKNNAREIIKSNEKILERLSYEITEIGKLFSKMTILEQIDEEDYIEYKNNDIENNKRDIEYINENIENHNILLINNEKYKIKKYKIRCCLCSIISICIFIIIVILIYKNNKNW